MCNENKTNAKVIFVLLLNDANKCDAVYRAPVVWIVQMHRYWREIIFVYSFRLAAISMIDAIHTTHIAFSSQHRIVTVENHTNGH